MNERRLPLPLPGPVGEARARRRKAGVAAALAAAMAAGYGGRQVQIELRHGEAMPTSAEGWDCTTRPRLADGTPVCFPKSTNEVQPPPAAAPWTCEHVGPRAHVARGACPFDVCRMAPAVRDAPDGGAP